MPEHEAQVWAVYDHETEEPRATGRRRRQVADWGVGEDVFDRMPSRRFARRGVDPQEHRRAEPRREDADWDDEPRTDRFARLGDEAPLDDAPRRERRPAADWLAEVTPRPAPEPTEEPDADEPLVLEAEIEAPKPRRTIVIGGHPDKLPAPRPRRPPRTAAERLGASPDRIMGYAVALGLLLILIAVLTTGH
jgi:hypothetical protein